MTNKKIETEIKKIGNLKLRIDRLINISQNKSLYIQEEFNKKINKVYTLIELSQERIRKEKTKEFPKSLDYDFGIDWIHGKTTEAVPIEFNDIEHAKEYVDEELGLEVLQ